MLHWSLSQATRYSTKTASSAYPSMPEASPANGSSTLSLTVVTNVYSPSGLTGRATSVAHAKKPDSSTRAPSEGLHLSCTRSPFTVVSFTCSSSPL